MRLALSTRIVLWIAQRERDGISTDRENVYSYWTNQKGVTREEITAILKSNIVFQTLVEDV
jgi:hypothetical protein